MSGPKRSVEGAAGAGGLAALALAVSLCASPSVSAQTPRGPSPAPEKAPVIPVVEVRAPIGPRPEFYVQWSASAPGLSAKPVLKRGGQPKYPEASVTAKETGFTTLELCITAEGRPTDIRLLNSSGFARLDEALLAWIPTASYSPAMFQGTPLAVCGYRLTYEWRITSDR